MNPEVARFSPSFTREKGDPRRHRETDPLFPDTVL